MKSDIEFREMLGRLSDVETQALRESIEAEGVREPLTLWTRWTCPDCGEIAAPRYSDVGGLWDCDNCGHKLTDEEYEAAVDASVLVDGYNRYSIASALDIDVPLRFVVFADRAAVKSWIARNQLGRRNIGPEKAAYCRGILYAETKRPVGENQHSRLGQNVPPTARTSQPIAEQFGVSEKTIRRDAEFAEAVDTLEEIAPGTREKALAGELPKSRIVEAGKAAKAGKINEALSGLNDDRYQFGKPATDDAAAKGRNDAESMLEKIRGQLSTTRSVDWARIGIEQSGGLANAIKALIVCIPDEDKLREITEGVKLLRGMSIEAQKVGG